MALLLNKSVFFHIPATGGSFVREVVKSIGQPVGLEVSSRYAPPVLANTQKRFSFAFVRHPLSWYESYFNLKTHFPQNQWNPSIAFDRLTRAKTFENFVKKVIQNCPSYVSCMYKIFTEIDTPNEIDFIGRQESLREDLIDALTQAGEEFDPKVIKQLPAQNVSPQHPVWNEDLKSKVIELESFTFKRFNYDI